VDDLAADHGHEHLRGRDVLERHPHDVAVEDDHIRELALGVNRTRSVKRQPELDRRH
jgi:hypothetical protein